MKYTKASKEETMKRAIERSKLDRETNIELVETMWKQFSNLGIYELNVIDTTTHSIKDTVSAVQEKNRKVSAPLLWKKANLLMLRLLIIPRKSLRTGKSVLHYIEQCNS